MPLLEKELIRMSLEADSASMVIKKLSDDLDAMGAVKKHFAESVLEREKEFPTGLPTEPVKIAIPHTDGKYVNHSAIAIAKLKKPVIFKSMERTDEDIKVEMVFLLAIADPKAQMGFLSMLMKRVIQNGELLNKLKSSKNEDEILSTLSFIN